MTTLFYIAGGGAVGSLLRYWMSNGIHQLLGRSFPYGTLTVNFTGSILIGFLYVLLVERLDTSVELRAGLMIGLLGGFTTFSTFSLETLNLLEIGDHARAILNVVLSLSLCLSGCWLGIITGRQI